MATSGSSSFSLTISDVVDEAYRLCGGEPISGNDAENARRSLNLLLIDWTNRGILLWQLEAATTAVATSVSSYTLDGGTIDIMDPFIKRGNTDLPLTRLSYSDYAAIPVKGQTGRPTQILVDRQRDAPVVHLWPLPENATDTLHFWRVRQLHDVNTARQDPDVPKRFLPALINGLAYFISRKRKGVSPDRIVRLKAEYEETLARALESDEDNADLTIVPGGRRF
jgi:hypothetical protein